VRHKGDGELKRAHPYDVDVIVNITGRAWIDTRRVYAYEVMEATAQVAIVIYAENPHCTMRVLRVSPPIEACVLLDSTQNISPRVGSSG
jgi:hypothetical protein